LRLSLSKSRTISSNKGSINSGFAFTELGIKNYISQRQAVVSTIKWWHQVITKQKDPKEVCTLEIEEACKIRAAKPEISF
jgi:hypothetical protein